MKKSTYLMSALALIFVLLIGCCTKKNELHVLSGPYLGQPPPGSKPLLFMPGLISTNYIDHCIGFLRDGRVCVFSIWEKGTYHMYEKDGRWTQPEKVPWKMSRGQRISRQLQTGTPSISNPGASLLLTITSRRPTFGRSNG